MSTLNTEKPPTDEFSKAVDCIKFNPVSITSVKMMQARVADFSNRVSSILPQEYRGELWIYAAGFVVLYTLLMLFRLSTFGFICLLLYVILIVLLVLRHYGHGPLASGRS